MGSGGEESAGRQRSKVTLRQRSVAVGRRQMDDDGVLPAAVVVFISGVALVVEVVLLKHK